MFFDDAAAITDNESIHGSWGEAWWPKKGSPTASRPLSNATLWINYQWTGLNPWSYLLVNRVLHLLTALLLFTLVRESLQRVGGILSSGAGLACASGIVAGLWLLHPLTTDVTAYSTQRTEVLSALFLMLAWWLAVRAWRSPEPTRWVVLAVISAMMGVVAKEVAALAFAMVLMWDLAFMPGKWRSIFRRRWGVYLAMFAGPAIVLGLIFQTDPYPNSIGFHHPISPWTYLLTQGQVILMYFQLSVWPVGLAVWHEVPWKASLSQAWPTVLPVAGLVLLSLILWIPNRTRWLGFLLLSVFVLLGPTSSVIPIVTEPAAERRMYLPAAALTAAGVLPVLAWMARRHLLDVALILSVALGVAYAGLTWQRFGELRKADLAWLHVLYLYPHSAFAASGVGQSFFEYDTSIEVSNRYYEIGYHLSPNDWRIAGAYGLTLNRLRRWEEAVPVLERSIEIAKEKYPDGLAELGDAYLALKHEQKAIDAFARRVLIDTTNASYRNDMGVVLAHFESYVEAIDQYQRARAINPAMGIVALNLGDVLLKVNRPDLAEPQLRDAVELIEDDSVLWGGYGKLGLALSQMNRLPEAIVAYQKTVDLFDKDAEVWNNYGITLGKAGLLEEAIEAFEKAIKLDPDYSEPRENLDTVRALMLRPPAQPTPE